jgi:sulfite exporter TauE/SafE
MEIYTWLLPFYISANLHCLGMCGPLAAMLSRQKYRWLYLLGRLFSFALGGALSGAVGMSLSYAISPYYISALITFGLCVFFLALGFHELGMKPQWIPKKAQVFLSGLSLQMAGWVNKGKPSSLFLFGLATLLLPCGQSWMLFSALALYGSALNGALNGALFALLTTPSLYLAMVMPAGLKAMPLSFKRYSPLFLALFWWLNSLFMFYRLALMI